MGNRPLENALRSAGQQIAEGKGLTMAFTDVGLFPPLVIRMLRIGENTGALDRALLNVSYFYNREVRESIGKVQAMIEPAMTIVLGAILGWVMLAVLGPGLRHHLEDEVLLVRPSAMSAKLVVYFTANGHALYRWGGGALELESRFSPDEQGLDGFRAHLKGHRGALVYVLADLAGEDFHEDQIPYLRGGDRQAVIDRRLAQRYRDTRLATALTLGIVTGERRSERLLLASFTNAQQFTDWLDALAESGARLVGRLLGAAARAGAARPPRRAQRARVRGEREQHRSAAVLRRGRPPSLRAPGAHRRHGAAGAGPVRARRNAAPGAVPVERCARCRAKARRCRCWSSRPPPCAPLSSRRWFPTPGWCSARWTSTRRRKRSASSACPPMPRASSCSCTSRCATRPRSSSRAAKTGAASSCGGCSARSPSRGAAGFAACLLYAGARIYRPVRREEPDLGAAAAKRRRRRSNTSARRRRFR